MGNKVLLFQLNRLSKQSTADFGLESSSSCFVLGIKECAAKIPLFFQTINIEKNVPVIMALNRC